ncbi:excalibur calcium-binding domain-containing protein [Nonomuraea jiangxiensis]|uniref:Excalibur calcium-binding domain-containing protein n=1 Tax=Nonomuraea jiangxiensis TaxID=633440 RepID=A0A1G8RI26_9ACTN|nr:excalibur calcium-binding domain-containing protein [Nonomuraea jiangxiensis]SDJ16714.1 Excalibur calcium-binding domain-containing protein [Nonomuraea jiangxiensis]
MDKPEEPPPADPGEPTASRLTTIVLIVSLVLVVLVAGVLGTVAVLMTRSPDQPLLGGAPPQQLSVPIHFAPVREAKAAPCPGEPAVLDEEERTCYLLEDGVTVGAVQQIEPVREKDGRYSVRIAIAPSFKQRLADLIDEQVPEQRQLAIVLAPQEADAPKTVLAAPVVTQTMDGDSMSISGFTKEQADALVARLLGSTPSPTAPTSTGTAGPTDTTGTTGPGTTGTTGPGTTGTTGPGTTGTTGTIGPNPGTTGTTGTGATGTTNPGAGGPGGTGRALDKRYASCKEAVAAGDGPYSRGTHEEYTWYTDVDNNGVACNSGDLR